MKRLRDVIRHLISRSLNFSISWSRRGLLLFEVSIAITIMAIAVVWMLRSFSHTLLALERARRTAIALNLINEQLLYAEVRGGAPVAGDQGQTRVGREPQPWTWLLTTTPLTDSQLLQTDVAVRWSVRDRAYDLHAMTWLPSKETN